MCRVVYGAVGDWDLASVELDKNHQHVKDWDACLASLSSIKFLKYRRMRVWVDPGEYNV